MTFKQNIYRYITGEVDLREIPAFAFSALENGMDSPSLRILAGLSGEENSYQIEAYLRDTMKELEVEMVSKREAAIQVGLAYAEKIFERKKTIFGGAQCIKWYMLDVYPFSEEIKEFLYDSIGFSRAYGLFVTLDDLHDSGSTQWQSERTNMQIESELNDELFLELRKWSEEMKNHS